MSDPNSTSVASSSAKPLAIPALSLILLAGISGSGKSTFASKHFGQFEVLSSDFFRGLLSNNPMDQSVTQQAFDALKYVAAERFKNGLLTVIDATHVKARDRARFIEFARENDVLPVFVLLDVPIQTAIERDKHRGEKQVGEAVIRRQYEALKSSLKQLNREGFRRVHLLKSEEQIETATFIREPLLTDKTELAGPFDVIGDVHGCIDELVLLLEKLGYQLSKNDQGQYTSAEHPDQRRVIFLGDLVDRGPDSVAVLRLAMGMVKSGQAFAVPGNHEAKLIDALDGKKVTLGNGLAETIAQLSAESNEFRKEVRDFCYSLVSHLVFDSGKLVVAHAGLKEAYHNRSSGRVRAFALYGDTTGEKDEYGLPVRYPWQNDYRGSATVLYGHTPVVEAVWVNNTMCLDTACVFGGKLSALRYPEREVVSVAAKASYAEAIRPPADLLQTNVAHSSANSQNSANSRSANSDSSASSQNHSANLNAATQAQRPAPSVLTISDVLGERFIETETQGKIKIQAEQSAAALETISRFGIDPRWLVYLPPTMSPVETAKAAGLLEHPEQAFSYYRNQGVAEVIVQEKHMGSRAIVFLGKTEAAVEQKLGIKSKLGMVYTRTGRAFFSEEVTEKFIARLNQAAAAAGLWENFKDWILFDAEILPWSLKAESLIAKEYAPIGAAADIALNKSISAVEQLNSRGIPAAELEQKLKLRLENIENYSKVYGNYRWQLSGLDGVEFAPFQILASAEGSYSSKDHLWHLSWLNKLSEADNQFIRKTENLVLKLNDESAQQAAIDWWLQLTNSGGEGVVVKPLKNYTREAKGVVQPGVKVRGQNYLRIIYGPDYTLPENLIRLRDRNLKTKRALALREYALGLESIRRLVENEPLWRVYEAASAVLALESDPIDPRL